MIDNNLLQQGTIQGTATKKKDGEKIPLSGKLSANALMMNNAFSSDGGARFRVSARRKKMKKKVSEPLDEDDNFQGVISFSFCDEGKGMRNDLSLNPVYAKVG